MLNVGCARNLVAVGQSDRCIALGHQRYLRDATCTLHNGCCLRETCRLLGYEVYFVEVFFSDLSRHSVLGAAWHLSEPPRYDLILLVNVNHYSVTPVGLLEIVFQKAGRTCLLTCEREFCVLLRDLPFIDIRAKSDICILKCRRTIPSNQSKLAGSLWIAPAVDNYFSTPFVENDR